MLGGEHTITAGAVEAAKEKLKAGRKAVSDAKMAIQATLGEKA